MSTLININFVSPCNLICNIPYFCWIITFARRRSNLPLPSLNRGQHSIVFNVNALWSYGELKYRLPQIFPKRRRIHWRAHRSHSYASRPTLLLLNWRGGLEKQEVFLRPREIEGSASWWNSWVWMGRRSLQLCTLLCAQTLSTPPLCSGRWCHPGGSGAVGGELSCVQKCLEALAFGSVKKNLLNKKSHKKMRRSSDRGLGTGEVDIWEHLGAPEVVASVVTSLS